jgi:hypothetical protein
MRVTDPYGHLHYAIGSADDFICFDFTRLESGLIRLHAVLNSETGSFIMNFEDPVELPDAEAIPYAVGLVDKALDWCGENEVEHDKEGWNQDPMYFADDVKRIVNAQASN